MSPESGERSLLHQGPNEVNQVKGKDSCQKRTMRDLNIDMISSTSGQISPMATPYVLDHPL
jgi:hypothetical protein